ncbi:MAG: Outer membrane TonB-dependent transporter, utilization system for glycans and polysaccharides (PUL), SusC family [uncultured Cytophagales bacterium]|uniref:Outer membrane TonB-dependent transporter, utilization system for glycans and polysaccharides (PUL), SusC family n=1 Tax=uncultured Cytophagales bacterium TaxID=158755 RepID=A0A6J4JYM2_9SPHI|nr:MAG: Outer membrane TonB-dependent transporter, utilization system for glycans and polysaccharides (PUL), SusC family [uncultured Cytophagales bacterium]
MQNHQKLTSFTRVFMKVFFLQTSIAALLSTLVSAHPGTAQEVLDRKITLQLEEQAVKTALSSIEKQADVRFMYSHQLIGADRKISIRVADEQLSRVLSKLLPPLRISYEIKGNRIILNPAAPGASATPVEAGQPTERTVTGRVTAQEDQSALPGVSVVVKGTTTGTATDAEGRFSLSVPDQNAVLVFSFIGFLTEEVAVGDRSTVDVALVADVTALGEVVVVGYGEQKKSLVTGAISSVKAEDIATVSATRVDQALQGRTAGVNVLPASGSPGSAMRVRIRGTGSNGSSEPLYIVDGVRAGGIEYLNPNEIASIEVLKDAASAAIYGAEGANGVVIITTKSGKTNTAAEVNYNFQYGQQSVRPNVMKMMNPQQYQQYLTESNTAGTIPTPDDVAGLSGTNWLGEIFQNAPQQNHALTFSGGGEKSTYLVGATYFTQKGIVGGDKSKFDRYTVRINTEHQIKPWLTIGERLSYANFARTGVAEDSEFGGLISSAVALDPITPVAYTGALPAHVQAAVDAGQPLVRDADGNYYGLSNYIRGEYGNPLARIDLARGNTVQNKVVGNLYATLEPIKGLKITTRFGIDGAFQRQHNWTPTFWFSSESLNTIANASDRQDNWFNWQWENFANYQKSFGNHNFTFLAGTSALKRMYNYIGGSYSGLFKEEDRFSYADGTPDALDRIGSTANVNTLVSYYGRLSYDFANKYLLNATIRRDGSSFPAPSHRWGTFPSVSVGWVLSNEDFFPSSGVLNSVKLRASWGQNGSLSNLTLGQWQSAIVTQYFGQPIRYPDAQGNYLVGAAPANLQNPDLTWETSEQVDFGLDLGLFNNQLTFTGDYYRKTTKDLITPGTPPRFAGNSLPFVNGGDVLNRGFEFEAAYRNGSDRAFKYEISGNLTTIHNEVTYLNPNVNEINGAGVGTGWTATVFKKGYPIWYFSGYKTDGIFQSQPDIDNYLSQTGITGYAPKPGDPVVVDVNGDGQITSADQTYIGKPNPDLFYGARVNLSYKGFDFLVFLQGQAGNDILMGFNRTDRPTANKPAFFYTDRWTGEGSTNQWFAANTGNIYAYNSDLMVFKGSYARVRQLQLGYTLPASFLERVKVKNARLYVSLDNYFTFTKYPGMDPEAGSGNANSLGIDRGVYPIPRNMLGGLSVTF